MKLKDPTRIPHGSHTDPTRIPHGSRMHPTLTFAAVVHPAQWVVLGVAEDLATVDAFRHGRSEVDEKKRGEHAAWKVT